MIEATVELHDRTEVQWIGEAIPRTGDHIFLDSRRYEVVQVQWHCEVVTGRRARLYRVRILVGGPIS